MPDKIARSTTTTAPSTTVPTTETEVTEQDLVGNEALKADIEGGDSGLSNFEATWRQISSEGAITEYAVDAVDGALSSVREWIRNQADADQAATAAMFVFEVQKLIDAQTRRLMSDYGISQWISEQPGLIAAGAMTAAAAFVITDQKIPELEKTLDLGDGHSLSGSVDLGSALQIAVKSLELGYGYKSDTTQGSLVYSQDLANDDWKLRGRLEADLDQMGLVNFADDLRAYVRGSYQSDGSWDSTVGIDATKNDWSYGVEAYAKDGPLGDEQGVRASVKFKF